MTYVRDVVKKRHPISLIILALIVAALTFGLSVQSAPYTFFPKNNRLTSRRVGYTATVFPNGKALVAGGMTNHVYMSSTELYDLSDGTWTETGSMNIARWGHSAILLTNGKVLVTGGLSRWGYLTNAECYDPNNGTWTETGSMNVARFGHSAILLTNGKVLVAGGFGASGFLTNAECYDPTSGTWTVTGSMHAARYYYLRPLKKAMLVV